MSEEEKRAPEVRFAGFYDDWKQRKLDKLASFSKGSGYSKKNLIPYGYPIILYGRLYTKYETVIQNVDTYVSKKEKSIISNGNEVIVPASGESAEDISRASVVANSGVILGGDLNIITLKENIEPVFLALTISNGKQKKELRKRAQGKSVVHLHNSDLKEVNLTCPSRKEQKKISEFFRTLENTIALHQRKLDKLQDLKKAALQSMFAQKDETEPKVRFTNFDEPWKHCNLGELVIIRSGFTGDAALNEGKYFLTRIETIASGEINFERVGYTNSKPDNKYLLTAGDILYSNINSLSQIGKVAQYQSRQPLYHGINLLRLSAKDVIDSRFLIQALRTNDKKVWAMSHANPAVNQASINQTELAKQTFVLPNKNEQREIGVFLSDLDDVITLYHKKLENLHELKKSFLQKMFI